MVHTLKFQRFEAGLGLLNTVTKDIIMVRGGV